MKKITTNHTLTGNGKVFTLSLKALFRLTGVGGATSTGAVPAPVLDSLKVLLVQPNVTGVVNVPNSSTGVNHYTVANDVLTITVGGLHAGQSILTVRACYGTNTESVREMLLYVKDGATGTDASESLDLNATDNFVSASDARITELEERVEAVEEDVDEMAEKVDPLVEAELVRDHVYGVLIAADPTPTTVTRIGNMDLHRSLPIQSGMVGGLLADDGTFTPFENQSDWTSYTRDGSAGQVMVKLPEHWRKITVGSGFYTVELSDVAITGFDHIGEQFISAYKAALDRTDAAAPKLASVVNTTAAFRGGNNTADWDGTYRSLLGTNSTNQTMATYRAAARRRGAGWEQYNYYTRNTFIWLYVVEYANRNWQAAYNSTLDSNGCKQGGLGDGVTNMPNWGTYNSYNPFIPCGTSDSLGNGTGVVNYAVKNAEEATVYTAPVNRYRGVEMPFGHTWDFCDGVIVEAGAAVENGGTGLHKVFLAPDPANWGDTDVNDTEKYDHVANQARSDGYIKVVEPTSLVPTAVGGSATTYYADYAYQNIPSSGNALRCALVGNRADYGASAGAFFWYSIYGLGYSLTYFGCRLCYLG